MKADGTVAEAGVPPVVARQETTRAIGQVLMLHNKISEREAEKIRDYAQRRNIRFGEAGIKLGMVSRRDVELALAAQFDYPYLEKGTGGFSSKLVTAFEPFSVKGEAVRILRAQLSRLWFEEGHRALAVVGPSGREGSSYLAANLAVAFSQLGRSTVLIDADLKSPTQHQLFKVDSAVGLSSVLVGRVPVEAVIRRVPEFRDLSLVPAGVMPPNAYELFGRAEMRRVVAALAESYQVVLFDAAAFTANLGAELIASQCGGALMVIRKDHTRLSDARRFASAVSEAGSVVVGSALTQF